MELSSPKSGVSFRFYLRLIALMSATLISVACMAPNSRLPTSEDSFETRSDAININTATAVQLVALDGIGPKTAQKIVDHREEFGQFRKPAEVMLVEGIGEKQFRKIRDLIRTQ